MSPMIYALLFALSSLRTLNTLSREGRRGNLRMPGCQRMFRGRLSALVEVRG